MRRGILAWAVAALCCPVATCSGCGSGAAGCQRRDSTDADHSGALLHAEVNAKDGEVDDDGRKAELLDRAYDILGRGYEIYVDVEDDWLVARIQSGPETPTFEELRCPKGMVKIPGRVDPPLAPFCISDTLVTAVEYRRCVEKGRCSEPDSDGPQAERYGTYYDSAFANYPINYVDREQAASYCAFVGGLVPSEEEWLWVYGSAGLSRFPWGDDVAGQMQVCARLDGRAQPPLCPVRSFSDDCTQQGVYDMAGSLAEMVRVRSSAFPSKLILKPAARGELAHGENSEAELSLLDVRAEDGNAKGLGVTYVVSGGAGAGFRCVRRQLEK